MYLRIDATSYMPITAATITPEPLYYRVSRGKLIGVRVHQAPKSTLTFYEGHPAGERVVALMQIDPSDYIGKLLPIGANSRKQIFYTLETNKEDPGYDPSVHELWGAFRIQAIVDVPRSAEHVL